MVHINLLAQAFGIAGGEMPLAALKLDEQVLKDIYYVIAGGEMPLAALKR